MDQRGFPLDARRGNTHERAGLGGKPSLLDQFDYAMSGVVYKFKHLQNTKVEAHISHGGLLARFVGDQRHLSKIKIDAEIFTLIRKLSS